MRIVLTVLESTVDLNTQFVLSKPHHHIPKTFLLPSSSYYAIKDLDTNEYVVDFDENYTKISADPQSSYFTVYMNGLEPERQYQILIKTIVGNEIIVYKDNNFNFKVQNG